MLRSNVRVNPKLIISQYYDSLINHIDIHTEKLLESYKENDLLEKPEEKKTMIKIKRDPCYRKLFEFSPQEEVVKDKFTFARIRDPYQDNFYEGLKEPRPKKPNSEFVPNKTKTHYFLNKTRDEMIDKIMKAQDHTFTYYETIKDKLKLEERQGSREEVIDQLKSELFATKFLCLFEINYYCSMGIGYFHADTNPSIFQLYLFSFDFYISKQDMNILSGHSVDFLNGRIFLGGSEIPLIIKHPHYEETLSGYLHTELNQTCLLLYLARSYIIGLFDEIDPFVHVFDICKSKLLSVSKICYTSKCKVLFNKINLNNECKNTANEYSNIKSIEIEQEYQLYQTRHVTPRIIPELVSLAAFTSLENLSLRQTHIFNTSFLNLINLKCLNLEECDFETVNSQVFHSIPNLEMLKMPRSKNHKNIDFAPLKHLKYLEFGEILNCNFLKTISKTLETLNIAIGDVRKNWNRYGVNSPYTEEFLTELAKSTCRPKTLIFSHSEIDDFDTKHLSNLTNLKHLWFEQSRVDGINLHHDYLSNLESMVIIDSVKSSLNFSKLLNLTQLALTIEFTDLSANIFSDLQRLEKLKLRVDKRTLAEKLKLRFVNKKTPVPSGPQTIPTIFKGLDNLRILDLRSNSAIVIDSTVFSYIPKLERLDLSHNQLSSLDSQIFQHLINIKYLNLSNNKIRSIPTFTHLENIETLRLDRNKLEHIPLETFNGLKKLKFLSLNENNFNRIDPMVFSDLPHLKLVLLDEHLKNREELEYNASFIFYTSALFFS